jgi:cytochrome c5
MSHRLFPPLLFLACVAFPAATAADGQSIYNSTCSACHNLGVAGAPKLGDTEAWSERITKDKEELYSHAINGFVGDNGVMPPKGGFNQLSDDEIKSVVDFMVSAAE